MKNVSDKNCGQKQDTHFMFSKFFFWKSCHIWGNVEKQAKVDNIVRCMHISCYRHTQIICNSYRFSTARMVVWMRLSIMFILTFPVLLIYDLDEFWPSKGETLAWECSWTVWNTLVSPNTDIITYSVCCRGLSWSKNQCFIKNITCFYQNLFQFPWQSAVKSFFSEN